MQSSSEDTCRLFITDEKVGGGRRFSVLRNMRGRVQCAAPVELPDPAIQAVSGSPTSILHELRWYLESYCDYPWPPNKERADRLLDALRAWGAQIFQQLFGNGMAAEWYRSAVRNSYKDLELTVSSDDPAVHAWPWEAIFELNVGHIAYQCKIDRQLNAIPDPPASIENIHGGSLQVLMITSRPYRADVDYCGIAQRVLDVTESYSGVEVKLLRPPTFDALLDELGKNAGKYQIIHFDGHGQFSEQEKQGGLVFEDSFGDPNLVLGRQLSAVLREHRIQTVVLNACQSGSFGIIPKDPFASVATSLLQAGVRSVLSMSHSVYVKAAQLFLPAFYERLLSEGDVGEAVRAGRQALSTSPERAWGFNLDDWLVPTLYQNQPTTLTISRSGGQDGFTLKVRSKERVLIGRDNFILALDRACRRNAALIVLKGLSGVGKTTIATAYLEWVKRTDAGFKKAIFISLKQNSSFDRVIARLFEECCSNEVEPTSADSKYRTVVDQLKTQRFLVVLDNFDIRSEYSQSNDDLVQQGEEIKFRTFAEDINGGATKIIVTTRIDVSWLKPSYKLVVQGLQGPDRARLAEEILKNDGLSVLELGSGAHMLADFLGGHPLMMRVMLPKLSEHPADSLVKSLKDSFDALDGDGQLQVVLKNIEDFLPSNSEPELFLLSLHVGYAFIDYLVGICSISTAIRSRAEIKSTLLALQRFGLVHQLDHQAFEMHPALGAYLQARNFALEKSVIVELRSAFARGIAERAAFVSTQQLNIQHVFFMYAEGTVRRALGIAKEDGAFELFEMISLALGKYLGWLRNKRHAEAMIDSVVGGAQSRNDVESQMSALFVQGKIAQEGYEYERARGLFKKALGLTPSVDDAWPRLQLLRALGCVERETGNVKGAKAYFSQCLKGAVDSFPPKDLASFYYDIGMLAVERRRIVLAKRWFLRTMQIAEPLDDVHAICSTSVQLAYIAQKQGDLGSAKTFLHKASKLNLLLGDEYGRSVILSDLAAIAVVECDAAGAERLYIESLRLAEKIPDNKGIATMSFRLGDVALMRQDFASAAKWFERCLSCEERYRINLTENAKHRLSECLRILKESK